MSKSSQSSAPLPEAFRTRICNLYGQEGEKWLRGFPALRQELRTYWALQDAQPTPLISYNYLEYARSLEHGPVILKIGYPNPELDAEIAALSLYQDSGAAVRLLDQDRDLGALLLERIIPGKNLTSLPDDQAGTRIAASCMLKLRQPGLEQGTFPSLRDWCQAFSRYQHTYQSDSGPIPGQLISQASVLAEELLETPHQQELLHGDLHHGNLLSREDGSWVVIDPKGVWGDFAAEIGPYLFNPIPDLLQLPDLEQVIKRRLSILAEMTGLDRQHLTAWSLCRTVLAAIWTVEEGTEDAGYFLPIAEILARMNR